MLLADVRRAARYISRVFGLNFPEAYCRTYGATHDLLTITEAAQRADPLTRHVAYSQIDLRATYPA